MTLREDLQIVEKKMTWAEWGVIISLIGTTVTGGFTAGVLYGQVAQNSEDIDVLQKKTDQMTSDVAEIKANVRFLADLAREERSRR